MRVYESCVRPSSNTAVWNETQYSLRHFAKPGLLLLLLLTLRLLLLLLPLPLALQSTGGFGLSKNVVPFFPTLSNFSLPAFEDLFLLPLSIFSWVFLFFSSLPVLEWRSFWVSYPPQFSLRDLTSLSFALLSILLYFLLFLISSSSRFVRLFHSPFSYSGSYILLNIFLSKISRACSSFFVNVHASAPYDTNDLISALYNIILVALDKSRLPKRLIAAK